MGSNGQTHQMIHRYMGPDIKRKYSEITSGKTMIQQGLITTCKDLLKEPTSKVSRRMMV